MAKPNAFLLVFSLCAVSPLLQAAEPDRCADPEVRQRTIDEYITKSAVAGAEIRRDIYLKEKGRAGTPLEGLTPKLTEDLDADYSDTLDFAKVVNGDQAAALSMLRKYRLIDPAIPDDKVQAWLNAGGFAQAAAAIQRAHMTRLAVLESSLGPDDQARAKIIFDYLDALICRKMRG